LVHIVRCCLSNSLALSEPSNHRHPWMFDVLGLLLLLSWSQLVQLQVPQYNQQRLTEVFICRNKKNKHAVSRGSCPGRSVKRLFKSVYLGSIPADTCILSCFCCNVKHPLSTEKNKRVRVSVCYFFFLFHFKHGRLTMYKEVPQRQLVS